MTFWIPPNSPARMLEYPCAKSSLFISTSTSHALAKAGMLIGTLMTEKQDIPKTVPRLFPTAAQDTVRRSMVRNMSRMCPSKMPSRKEGSFVKRPSSVSSDGDDAAGKKYPRSVASSMPIPKR